MYYFQYVLLVYSIDKNIRLWSQTHHHHWRSSKSCYYFQCYLMLLCRASDSENQWSISKCWQTKWLTFNPVLSMIPTWSSNPTAYLPRFSPLCVPDKPLNPITATFNFHFPLTTWVQWAVIPKNPIFIVSTNHPSAVTDTFPGASYLSKCEVYFNCASQMHCEGILSHYKYLADQMMLILASWQ